MKFAFCFFIMLFSFLLSFYLALAFMLKTQNTVTCPDLTGMSVNEAELVLEKKGLKLQVSGSEKRKDVPKDMIVRQRPEPGISIKRGRKVYVTLSSGPEMVIVPDFRGLTLEAAEALASQKNLKIKETIFVPSKNHNKILAHIPDANEKVVEGGGITLIIGKSPVEFFVAPDISGWDFNSILEELESKNIPYKVVFKRRGNSSPESKVELEKKEGTIFRSDETLIINVFLGG